MFLFILAFLATNPITIEPPASDEFYFLRRIADFWDEEEYDIAKVQMEKFLQLYPESPHIQQIQFCLGNLFFHEGKYEEALNYYHLIASDPSLQEELFSNKLQCLYRLKDYSSLMQICEDYLQDQNKNKIASYFLAICLYDQALLVNDSNELQCIIQKAENYFPKLIEENFSLELAKAYAHLSLLIKDYPKAVKIYLDIAKNFPEEKEEMLCHAALAKVNYDPDGALSCFEDLSKGSGKWAMEASFHRFELLFTMERFDEIIEKKNDLLNTSEKHLKDAYLLFGKSLLATGQQQEAVLTLKEAIHQNPDAKDALYSLIEAAFKTKDLAALDFVLQDLSSFPEMNSLENQTHFCKCALLKELERWDEARKELTFLPQEPRYLLEKIDLELKAGNLLCAQKEADSFLNTYPKHPLSSHVYKALICALQKLDQETLPTLQKALTQPELFSHDEITHFEFLQAKALFDLGKKDAAAENLEALLSQKEGFNEEGDCYLLLSLCKSEPDLFCRYAEKGLAKGGTLCDTASLSLTLYNSYLESAQLDKCAEHLFRAFELQAEINEENLLWLGEWYLAKDPFRAKKVFSTLHNEQALYRLAEMEPEEKTLQALLDLYKEDNRNWQWRGETELLLCEFHLKKENIEEALIYFDRLFHANYVNKATLKKAELYFGRLKAKEGKRAEAADLFKNLMQQRELVNEPTYLEAALDYIDLLGTTPQKRLSLLEKIKEEWMSTNDLLGKDYHAARVKLDEKNALYEAYIQWIEGEILWEKSKLCMDEVLQKELQTNAKELFLKYSEEGQFPFLQPRALQRITNAQE